MKVYIAHNFAARDYLNQEIIPLLRAAGHECTSSWIWDDSHLYHKNAQQSAVKDLADIDKASDIIIFLNAFADRTGRGKWFEFGYALRAGKRCIAVGEDKSCIFCNLPNIRLVATIEDAMRLL